MIPVYYCNAMNVVDDHGGKSPSLRKPALAVADWLRSESTTKHVSIKWPGRVEPQRIMAVHETRYVSGVLAGTRNNGFGNSQMAVATALPWIIGSIVTAAHDVFEQHAKHGGATVACSPTSGFHHARWDGGGGYCTFNGLMLAALQCFSLGGDRVVIFDGDRHFGDGTADIIRRMGWGSRVSHLSFEDLIPGLPLRRALGVVKGASLVLYQAGADGHEADPMCGSKGLRTSQLAVRDRKVFEACRDARVPVVWNLAGGYQVEPDGSIPDVLALHRQTMEICIDVYDD